MKTELITPPETQPPRPEFPGFYIGNTYGSIWMQVKPDFAVCIHGKEAFQWSSGHHASEWQGFTEITTPFTIKFMP